VSVILFLCALVVGIIALAMALAQWLTELIGVAAVAWLIIGVLFLVAALIIYFVSLHTTIKRINRRLDTVYEVSATVEMIYHQVALFIKKIVGGL
jgi:ABC-type antimicrobial peptide transport system permease subunit